MWVINNFEPVYIDDDWNDNNMCPVPCDECGCKDDCYWIHELDEEE